jgi:long-chain acyl-CoA synthetase
VNIAHLFARNAARAGDLPALALGARALVTHAGLARRAAAIAGSLRGQLRLGAGDRLALVAPNRPDYVELMAACWWAGLVVVPINVRLHPKEIAWILGHSGRGPRSWRRTSRRPCRRPARG